MRFLFAPFILLVLLASSVEAQLLISTDKDTLDFTKVKIGFSRDGTIRITNISEVAVSINHIVIINQNANPNEFQIIVPQPTTFGIDSGDGRTAIIRFTPALLGIRTALLDINTDNGDKIIQLIGEGARIQPDIMIVPDFVDFGTLAPGEFKDTTIMIIGGDKDSARIDWINVVNDNGEIDFDVTPVNTSITFPLIVHNGDTVLLDARFTGMNSNGPRTGRTIMEGDVSGSIICEFHGAVGTPDMTFSPQLLDLGIVPQGTSVDTFITVMSTGTTATKLQRIDAPPQPYSISGLPSLPFYISAGDSLNIPVHFNAIAPGDYEEPIAAFSKNGELTGINRSALLKAFVIPQVLSKQSPKPFVVSCAIDSVYQRILTITDTGNFPITISGVACSDSNFFITYPVSFPDTIGSGAIRNILVTYIPVHGSSAADSSCIIKVLTAGRAIISDTINVITQPENAQFGITQITSATPLPNSNSMGVRTVSDLSRYKLTSLDLELTINPPDVAEIDTLNVTIDNSVFPNATVKAGYDVTAKKYFALITSPTELPSSPVIPFLHIPLKYYVAKVASADLDVSMISPEKDGCINFDDNILTISSSNECGDQEIRNSLNNIPLFSSIGISPNPSHGNHITVSFSNAENISLSSELLDMNGKAILRRSGDTFVKGKNYFICDFQSVASGSYMIHFTARSIAGQTQDVFKSLIITH